MFKIRLAFYKLANKIEGMARNVQAVREREKFKERTWNFSYTYRKKKADLYNSWGRCNFGWKGIKKNLYIFYGVGRFSQINSLHTFSNKLALILETLRNLST